MKSTQSWLDHLNEPVPELPRTDRSQRQFVTHEECEAAFGFTLPQDVRNLLKQPFTEQRTPQWHLARQEAITSSDFAAAVGANPYQTRQTLIKKKVTNTDTFRGNVATEHGTFYEDCALYEYEKRTGYKVIDLGLMSHHTLFDEMPDEMRMTNEKKLEWFDKVHADPKYTDYTWLKGSPDGVAVHPETGDAVLLEIKCPYSSTSYRPQRIMCYYYPQVQMMMHLFNLKKCHFVQFVPAQCRLFEQKFDLLEIEYNAEWFEAAKNEARVTWDIIKRQRSGLFEELARHHFQPSRVIALFPECVYTPEKKTYKRSEPTASTEPLFATDAAELIQKPPPEECTDEIELPSQQSFSNFVDGTFGCVKSNT